LVIKNKKREIYMNIGAFTYEEFIDKVKSFHGSIAPGIVAGGIMVNIARANLPQGEFFDVICETGHCLPDAVQLLTPCTIGNRWLKIVDTSRYALTFFNKYTGDGIRVFLDARKLKDWPAIRAWFLKEKPKRDQDQQEIIDEFRMAGTSIYSTEKVRVKPSYITSSKQKRSSISLCPSCGEAYRADLGETCPACRGKGPYIGKGK
jgi:formylmethanofuran dehydrogenase subunit E